MKRYFKNKIYSAVDKLTTSTAVANWLILTWWMIIIVMIAFILGLIRVAHDFMEVLL